MRGPPLQGGINLLPLLYHFFPHSFSSFFDYYYIWPKEMKYSLRITNAESGVAEYKVKFAEI